MSNERPPQDPAERPDLSENPFDNPDGGAERPAGSQEHASDDPGRDYAAPEQEEDERYSSSGVGGPSEPRRPGTGERQAPRRPSTEVLAAADPVIPGELLLRDEPVVINEGAEITRLRVSNPSDRPIQVGSHYHFAEANPALQLDRRAAWGKRLNILAGGSVRFEPGVDEEVELVPIGGARIALGFRGECRGALDD